MERMVMGPGRRLTLGCLSPSLFSKVNTSTEENDV